MFSYQSQKVSDHITRVIDPAGVSLYLVEGRERAALLDTGVGFQGLQKAVEALTKLSVFVILTHLHPDHAGGAAEFDQVYLHPADLALKENASMDVRLGYCHARMREGPKPTAEDLLPFDNNQAFEGLSDGQSFELGGITLEIIHVPGHTPGSCCVLIPEERAILFGDACNANTLVFDIPVSRYRKGLEHLAESAHRFDTVLYSHGLSATGPNSLEDNLELCARILAGTDDKIPEEFMGRAVLRAAAAVYPGCRVDGKFGNIVYTEEVRN